MLVDVFSAALAFTDQPASTRSRAVPIVDRVWFALFLRASPRCVGRVEEFATAAGFETFAPRRKTVRRVQVRERGRKPRFEMVEVISPLLPRYMLVCLPRVDPPFRTLLSERAKMAGIVGFVRSELGAIAVPLAIVDELRRREGNGEFDSTVKRGRQIVSALPAWAAVGSNVRVETGAFTGIIGTVEEHVAEGRVRVALPIFGRSTPIEFQVADLSTARGS